MKITGIILAGGNSDSMGALTRKRAVAAIPVGGGYRAIDFALSSMVNSGMSRVEVITQYSSRSLNYHLNSGSWWGFGRKHGGLFVSNPTITADSSEWYRGTADSLFQNFNYLKESHEPYVAIAGGDGIYQLDYEKVLDFHEKKGGDVTVVCKELPAGSDTSRFGVVKVDGEGRLTGFDEKTGSLAGSTVSCGIYLMRRRLLMSLLQEAAEQEKYNLVTDILMPLVAEGRAYAYMHEGYWNSISAKEPYYACNMDFLKPAVRREFGNPDFPLLTKVDDVPPAKYMPEADVKDALVAGGAVLSGEVKHSVVFTGASVGEGSSVTDSLLLPDVEVGRNCVIRYCIIDSRVKIPDGRSFIGEPDNIKIVTKADI